jgi:hypothetical protein
MTRPYNVININGYIVPATFHDALKKILVAIKEGRVKAKAARRYVKQVNLAGDTCMCAIGALLTREQLAEILDEGMNGKGLSRLATWFGARNIEAMTAMTSWDSGWLQANFDSYAEDDAMPAFEVRLLRYMDEKPNYPNPAIEHTGAWHFPVSLTA